MKITATQYAKSLYELTEGKSEQEVGGIVANFVNLLQKNRQMKLAGKIIEIFNNIWNKEKGIVEAEVTTRDRMPEAENKKIADFIKHKYQAKEVVLVQKIDSSIKGGIVIKVGDEILDGSVARQLEELKNNLVK